MANRVTDDEVKTLLAPLADNSDVSLYTGQANMLVNEDLAGKGLSDDRLRYIELNLAAHFAVLAIERGGLTFQRVGEAQEGYANNRMESKYSSTRFGQQAMALDTTGTLTRADSQGGTAEFSVINPVDC